MRKSRILIADDDGDLLAVLARRLNARGHEIFTVSDGDQALESFEKHDFDLILLDIGMPKVDGLLVLREILEADPAMPVLVMSGVVTDAQARLAVGVGAREFLSKPLDLARLDAAVEAYLPTQPAAP